MRTVLFVHSIFLVFEFNGSEPEMGFPLGLSGKGPPVKAGGLRDTGLISRWGRSPGEGHRNPLQCSCLDDPMDRGAIGSIGSQGVGCD